MWNELWDAFEPSLIQIAGIAAAAVVSVTSILITRAVRHAEQWIEAKTGFEIEEQHSRLLHSAMETGAASAVDKLMDVIDPENAAGNRFGQYPTTEELIEETLNYVRQSVPDALAWLTPDEETLRRMARAKIVTIRSKLGVS